MRISEFPSDLIFLRLVLASVFYVREDGMIKVILTLRSRFLRIPSLTIPIDYLVLMTVWCWSGRVLQGMSWATKLVNLQCRHTCQLNNSCRSAMPWTRFHLVTQSYVEIISNIINSRGHAVAQLVEALRYKPEGRGIDSRWCHWIFSLT